MAIPMDITFFDYYYPNICLRGFYVDMECALSLSLCIRRCSIFAFALQTSSTPTVCSLLTTLHFSCSINTFYMRFGSAMWRNVANNKGNVIMNKSGKVRARERMNQNENAIFMGKSVQLSVRYIHTYLHIHVCYSLKIFRTNIIAPSKKK